jgi:hypothetical protein
MRDTPCAARGAEPLAFCSWRWGVAGRVDLPAEVGGGGRQYHRGPRTGRRFIPERDFEIMCTRNLYCSGALQVSISLCHTGNTLRA